MRAGQDTRASGVSALALVASLVTLVLDSKALAEGEVSPPGTSGTSTPAPAASTTSEDSDQGLRVWGLLKEEYRYRRSPAFGLATVGRAPAAADQDLWFLLDGGLVDGRGRLGVDVSGALFGDLDGLGALPAIRSFASIHDRASGVEPQVYVLSAHYTNQRWLRSVGVGRMGGTFGEAITFDGARLELRPFFGQKERWLSTLELDVFGGRTNHFYELDEEVFDDWVGSLAVRVRPHSWLRIEADYRLTKEDITEEAVDHHYGLAAWVSSSDFGRLKVFGRGLNQHLSNLGSSVMLSSETWNAGLEGSGDLQLITLGQLDERAGPLFVVLGESRPRGRWNLEAYKRFEGGIGRLVVLLGWAGRQRLTGESSAFNRSYGHAYSTLSAEDVLKLGLVASASAEYHYSADPEGEDLWALGATLGIERAFGRLELGTYYQRFKYDFFAEASEVADVRTYFASLSAKPWGWLRLQARYEFERFDRDLHTFTLGLAQHLDAGGP